MESTSRSVALLGEAPLALSTPSRAPVRSDLTVALEVLAMLELALSTALFVTQLVVEPLAVAVRTEAMMPRLAELPLAAAHLCWSRGCSKAAVATAHTEAMVSRLELVAAPCWSRGCMKAAVAMVPRRLVVWHSAGKHWRYQQAMEARTLR